MKVQVKIFRNPTEVELNKFLVDADVFAVQVIAEPSYYFNPEEASTGGVMVYIFYRQ